MTHEDVLAFWFADGPGVRREVWFKRTDAFDTACGEFRAVLTAALRGDLNGWSTTPRGALALVIVLDQLPRNIDRGTPKAFSGDAAALAIAAAAISTGFDRALLPVERVFLYLPFEHSEDLADQDRSVALFEALAGEPDMALTIDYAHRHRDVIRRFGRFPHRNPILGRTNSAAENAYLAEPGAGF